MKLGSKILLAALGAVIAGTVVGTLVQRNVIHKQGIELTRNTMRGAIVEAENVRQSISELNANNAFDSHKLLAEAKAASDLRATTLYKTIPVVAAWTAIEQLAKAEDYEFRVPKNHARNPKNNPVGDEAEILRLFEEKGEKEYFKEDTEKNQMVYARPIVLTQDCLTCHGDPANSPTKDGRDMLGFPMENWKVGEVHGAFVLRADLDRVDKVVAASVGTTITWMVPVVVLIGVGFFLFNRSFIVKPLSTIIGQLDSASQQTSSAGAEIAMASQSLAQGASEQAASLEETSASLEELSSMTKKNADTSQQAAGIASQAQNLAGKGDAAMTKMTAAINDIQKSSGETAKIIKVIDEIAFQTNLLALNAAVEAARAGEAGKGFAVVAEEVRNLAMRSAEAAKNTSQLIEQSVKNSQAGVNIAGEVSVVLGEMSQTSQKVNALIAEIAAATKEQSTGIDQINTAVSQMDKVTQQNAAGAEESAAACEELASQATELSSVVVNLTKLVGGGAAPNMTQRTAAPKPAASKPILSKPAQTAPMEAPIMRSSTPIAKPAQGRISAGPNAGAVGNDFIDFGEFDQQQQKKAA